MGRPIKSRVPFLGIEYCPPFVPSSQPKGPDYPLSLPGCSALESAQATLGFSPTLPLLGPAYRGGAARNELGKTAPNSILATLRGRVI